jgi:hypothetical protein
LNEGARAVILADSGIDEVIRVFEQQLYTSDLRHGHSHDPEKNVLKTQKHTPKYLLYYKWFSTNYSSVIGTPCA